MNIKALITTLVLGSSSMASADSLTVRGSVSVSLGSSTRPARPVVQEDCAPHAPYRPTTSRPIYQPTRPVIVQPVWHAPVYHPTNTIVIADASQYSGAIFNARQSSNSWFDLSEATRIDAGREFFTVGADKGGFRGLRLQALGNGRSKIDQVTIEFADAQGRAKYQVVKLDSWIGRGSSSLQIDLDGNYRQINRIIVYGSTDVGSAYKLMAL